MKKSLSTLTKCFNEKFSGIAIAISVFLLFTVTFLVQSNQAAMTQQKKDIYGKHNGCIYDVTEATASALKKHLTITEYGKMTIYGDVLCSDDTSAGNIGYVNENFIDLEDFSFLEGSFPEKENEIAMETLLLDQLHIPYELGQTVTLRIQQTNKSGSGIFVKEYSWKLCGIMDSYSINWKSDGYPLCSAFILDGVLPDSYSQMHLFFLSSHENEQQMQELQPLITDFQKSELIYNDYSYPENEFSIFKLLQRNTVILFTVAICVLFLICIQLGSYRRHMHNMRIMQMLGIDRKKLIYLLYGRTLQIWAVSYGITIAVCSIPAGILVSLKSIPQLKQFCFRISPVPYLLSAGVSLAIVLIGKSIQYFVLRKIELIPKGKALTMDKPVSTPGSKQKNVCDQKSFLKRERLQNRRFYWIEFLISLASIIVLAVSILHISNEIRYYRACDLVGGEEYLWESNNPEDGLSESDLSKIEKTSGIEKVLYTSMISYGENSQIFLRYQGAETDPYVIARNTGYELSAEGGMIANVVIIPENSVLWDYYISEDIDQKSFLSGNSVIVYLPDLMKNETDNTYTTVNSFKINLVKDTTEQNKILKPCLQQGDTAQIVCYNSNHSPDIIKNVTVEQIITKFRNDYQTSLEFFLPGTILVSDTLYKELFSLENSCYNYVRAFGNTSASYDITDKIMSSVTQNTNLSFINNRVETENRYQSMYLTVFFYSCIAILACISALVIIYRNRILFLETNKPRTQLLRILGCDAKVLQRLTMPKTYLFVVLVSIVLNVVLLTGSWYLIAGWQYHTGEFWNDWRRIFQVASNQFPWGIYLVPQGIYLFVYVFICRRKNS